MTKKVGARLAPTFCHFDRSAKREVKKSNQKRMFSGKYIQNAGITTGIGDALVPFL